MKVGIFQFNGCSKCFNETLYRCCAREGSQITEVVRIKDPKSWQGAALDAAVITGYLTIEDQPILKKISDHSKKMIAFGSCTATGGIFGLAYQKGHEIIPLHKFYSDSVDVNGCLGDVDELSEAVKGHIFSKTRSLCKVCARKSDCDYIEEVQRVIDVEENPEVCYNDQGLMCMGFIAIECKEACVNYGTPCRGCKPMVDRPGLRMMGMWGTLLGHIEVATEATGKGGTDKLADADDDITEANPDVVGQFFRFGLADSIMPVGRQISTGNILSDIFIGRILEELSLITGMMGSSQFVSLTLDVIEAYEIGIGMKISDQTKTLRKQLLNLETGLEDAAKDGNAIKYQENSEKIRTIAGNMNLSNVYFGGFKTPIEGIENYSDYKYKIMGPPVAGTYQKGMVRYTLDNHGIVTEFTMEVK